MTGCNQQGNPKAAGAAAAAAATGQDYMVAAKEGVPVYYMGPQQYCPPDQILNKDDLIWVVKKQFGLTMLDYKYVIPITSTCTAINGILTCSVRTQLGGSRNRWR